MKVTNSFLTNPSDKKKIAMTLKEFHILCLSLTSVFLRFCQFDGCHKPVKIFGINLDKTTLEGG